MFLEKQLEKRHTYMTKQTMETGKCDTTGKGMEGDESWEVLIVVIAGKGKPVKLKGIY